MLTQGIGERQAHAPHRGEVHHCRFECVAGAEADTEGHDAGRKERLGKSLDAQHARSQLADGCHRGKEADHLGGEDIHHHAHHGHHAHAQADGQPGKAAAEILPSGAKGLSDKRRGGVADTIAGHIAQALGGHGKRVGGNGDVAQRGNDHCGNNLRAIHQHILQSHRRTDLQSFHHIGRLPDKTLAVEMPSQDRTATHIKPYQDQRGDHIGQRRAQGGTLHA